MRAVTTVAHEFRATAEYAGSRRKSTDVCDYSDADIFVETGRAKKGKIRQTTRSDRKKFSFALIEALKAQGFNSPTFENKPVATVFCVNDQLSLDLVFSNPSWCDPPWPPDDTHFVNQPHRQRAVRALKLASKMVCSSLLFSSSRDV
jgi:hypothetical protein